TWRYIAQGAAVGGAIGLAIDTGGAAATLEAELTFGAASGTTATLGQTAALYGLRIGAGAALGAGLSGGISSFTSGGDWRAFTKGSAKGALLGGIGAATSAGLAG